MKIIYSSNVHGQTGTTTNMLTTAVMGDILFRKKSILLQTQFRLNQLEVPLLPTEHRKEALQYEIGMDALLKGIQAGKSTEELLKACCVSISKNGMDFLPGTNTANKEIYENQIAKGFHEILELADQLYEYVFIDVGPIEQTIAQKIWKEADILVINLCQNTRVLDDFFNNYELPEKTIYLIGNYDNHSTMNLKTLSRIYRPLKEENTFVIPYNTEFRDAISEAELFTYFYRNIICEREDENFYFVNEVKRAVRYIMESAEKYPFNKNVFY